MNSNHNDETYFIGQKRGIHLCSCSLNDIWSDTYYRGRCNYEAKSIYEPKDGQVNFTNATAFSISVFKFGGMGSKSHVGRVSVGRFKYRSRRQICLTKCRILFKPNTISRFRIRQVHNNYQNNGILLYEQKIKILII